MNPIPIYSHYDRGLQIGIWYEDEKLFVPIFDNLNKVIDWHQGKMTFLNLNIPAKENWFGDKVYVYCSFGNPSELTIYVG
jgi:hypothetical protein